MKDTNPIVPPGTNLENTNRGRSRMRIAVVGIVLAHVVILGGLLLVHGCSQEEETVADNKDNPQAKIVPAENADGTDNPGGAPIIPPPLPNPDQNPLPGTGPNPPIDNGNAGGGVNPPPDATPDPFAETTPAPLVGNTREHVILSGDNYWNLAKKYGVTMKDIQLANPNHDPNKLRIGKKLAIPAARVSTTPTPINSGGATSGPGVYIVKRGDTLSQIARRHGTKTKELQRVNNLTGTRIFPNQKLQLPPGARFSATSGTPGTE